MKLFVLFICFGSLPAGAVKLSADMFDPVQQLVPRRVMDAFDTNMTDFQNFIVNGLNAAKSQFPWMVSVQLNLRGRKWFHVCGGIILDHRNVLTAAHCAKFWGRIEHRIVAGSIRLETPNTHNAHVGRVSNVTIHPSYISTSIVSGNDLAVLHMDPQDHMQENPGWIEFATLPGPTDTYVGQTCSVVGWGRTEGTNQTLPDRQQYASVPIIDTPLCQRYWAINSAAIILPSNLCAHSSKNGAGALHNVCNGDSGGPLVCANNVIAGLVSWGRRGCVGCSPDVYTRLSAHLPWINTFYNQTETQGMSMEEVQELLMIAPVAK